MSMFNKFITQIMSEAYQKPDVSHFRRNHVASGRQDGSNTIDYWHVRSGDRTEIFASLSREEYDKYVSAPVNRLSNSSDAARIFFLYQHLKDSGQLGKWEQLKAARL